MLLDSFKSNLGELQQAKSNPFGEMALKVLLRKGLRYFGDVGRVSAAIKMVSRTRDNNKTEFPNRCFS